MLDVFFISVFVFLQYNGARLNIAWYFRE